MRRGNGVSVIVSITAVIFMLACLTTNAAANITLTIWDWVDWRHDLLAEYVERYREIRPDVNFELAIVPHSEYPDKLGVSVISGVPPEIANFHRDWTDLAMRNALLQPYPEHFTQSLLEEFIMMDSFIIEGKLYFLPTGIMTPAIYYNTDLLALAGIDRVPGIWTDFIPVAQRLTIRSATGQLTQTGFSWATNLNTMFEALLRQYGGVPFDDNGPAFGQAAGAQAMSLIETLLNADVSNRPGVSGTGSFQSGRVALKYNYTWLGGRMPDEAPDVNWDVAPLPTPTGSFEPAHSQGSYESAYAVPRGVDPEKTKAAFEFLEWLYAQDDYHIRLNVRQGRIPGKQALWAYPEVMEDPTMRVLAMIAPYAVVDTANIPPGWGELRERMRDRILREGFAPHAALAMAVEEAWPLWRDWVSER